MGWSFFYMLRPSRIPSHLHNELLRHPAPRILPQDLLPRDPPARVEQVQPVRDRIARELRVPSLD